jgi:hypothetical protein
LAVNFGALEHYYGNDKTYFEIQAILGVIKLIGQMTLLVCMRYISITTDLDVFDGFLEKEFYF